jgi:hypothetical protein
MRYLGIQDRIIEYVSELKPFSYQSIVRKSLPGSWEIQPRLTLLRERRPEFEIRQGVLQYGSPALNMSRCAKRNDALPGELKSGTQDGKSGSRSGLLKIAHWLWQRMSRFADESTRHLTTSM